MFHKSSIHPNLKAAIFLSLTVAGAFKLFTFGLGYPLDYRVRGDAYSYLLIADQLQSMADVLSFAGERTIGLPFFSFVVRKAMEGFSSVIYLQAWIDAIGLALFATHLTASWVFSMAVKKTDLIETELAAYVLFAFLATYPALIGYTTSPLSDTLAMDLTMLAMAAVGAALSNTTNLKMAIYSLMAACSFAATILVRPGSLIAVPSALLVCGCISLLRVGKKTLILGAVALGCGLILVPFALNCNEKYGAVCLQSPQTGSVNDSMQGGLRGARTLWAGLPPFPGLPPVLPDKIMVDHYYARCQVSTLFGTTTTSFTGCLASRPIAIPALVIKKWIGLFDHFRFTPYLEKDTPIALKWLSRGYDVFAWIGLFLLFHTLSLISRPIVRKNLVLIMHENIPAVLLGSYSLIMLAQHTVLHTEERYGFPLLPLCTTTFIIYSEVAIRKYRSLGVLGLLPILSACIFLAGLFVWQIIEWDNSIFY